MVTEQNKTDSPIIIAVTGASGIVYAFRALQFLLQNNYKVELIFSQNACKVASSEINLELSANLFSQKEQVLSYLKLYDKSNFLNLWGHENVAASISSGSYKTSGMIIIPASMGTIGAIANGLSNNLITRAADVCIKERRKLLVVPREMPLSTIHLENLLKLSRNNVIIAPASPAFYHNPKTLNESVDFIIGKIFDLFGIEHALFKRWKEDESNTLIFQDIKI